MNAWTAPALCNHPQVTYSEWGNMNGLPNEGCAHDKCSTAFESSYDYLVAQAATRWLQSHQRRPSTSPFFLLVGFWGCAALSLSPAHAATAARPKACLVCASADAPLTASS